MNLDKYIGKTFHHGIACNYFGFTITSISDEHVIGFCENDGNSFRDSRSHFERSIQNPNRTNYIFINMSKIPEEHFKRMKENYED